MARRGFTLSEVMVALFVSGIVLTAVMSSFLSAHRMMAEVMAESETALAARELREKLLFHAAPAIGGVHYAGMLSGTNSGWVVESGSGYVLMDMGALGTSLSDVRPQSMRLIMGETSGKRYLFNERIPNHDMYRGWLWPGRISLADSSMTDVSSVESSGTGPADVYRVNIDMGLAVPVPGMRPFVRRERVSVPLLGRVQPMKDSAGRY